MRIFRICLITVLFLMYSACSAVAERTNLYIDSINGNDSNPGSSPGKPKKSLKFINEARLNPGDTVFLKSGSVWLEDIKFTSSGSKGKPIVITSYGEGKKPAIDGKKVNQNNIYLYKQEFIEISNLFLYNSIGSGGIRIAYGREIKIMNCEFIVTGHGGVFIENSVDCIITGNKITSPSGKNRAQTDGIYSQRNNNIRIEKNRIVLKNDEPEGHLDGIQSYLDKDMIISSNFIFQDNSKTNSQGIYATNAQGKHIYINNIVFCPNTLASVIGFRNLKEGYGTLELYNNTLKSRGSNNLYITEVSEVTVVNNIFVTTSPAYIINIGSRIEDPLNSFNNNLYFRDGDGNVVNYPPGGGGKTFEQWQREGFDLNSILADPLLDKDLYITKDSPAIDAGAYLDHIHADFKGNSRKQGVSVDIGATELY